MIKLFDKGAYLLNGTELVPEEQAGTLKSRLGREVTAEEAKKRHDCLWYLEGTQ